MVDNDKFFCQLKKQPPSTPLNNNCSRLCIFCWWNCKITFLGYWFELRSPCSGLCSVFSFQINLSFTCQSCWWLGSCLQGTFPIISIMTWVYFFTERDAWSSALWLSSVLKLFTQRCNFLYLSAPLSLEIRVRAMNSNYATVQILCCSSISSVKYLNLHLWKSTKKFQK